MKGREWWEGTHEMRFVQGQPCQLQPTNTTQVSSGNVSEVETLPLLWPLQDNSRQIAVKTKAPTRNVQLPPEDLRKLWLRLHSSQVVIISHLLESSLAASLICNAKEGWRTFQEQLNYRSSMSKRRNFAEHPLTPTWRSSNWRSPNYRRTFKKKENTTSWLMRTGKTNAETPYSRSNYPKLSSPGTQEWSQFHLACE